MNDTASLADAARTAWDNFKLQKSPQTWRWIAIPLGGPNTLEAMAFRSRGHMISAGHVHSRAYDVSVIYFRDGKYYGDNGFDHA